MINKIGEHYFFKVMRQVLSIELEFTLGIFTMYSRIIDSNYKTESFIRNA